jgi:molybdopterin synthase sulfur carrier subunit
MKVIFYSTIRQVVGEKFVEIPLMDGMKVADLITELVRCYPKLKRELLDDSGKLHSHIHMFVNGRDLRFLEAGLDTILKDTDLIGFFPPVGGG